MANSPTNERSRRRRPWLRVVLAGVLATLCMDLGSVLLRVVHLTQGLPPNLIGRWFATLLQRTPIPTTIPDVPAVRGEIALALVGHYAIGTTLAIVFAGLLAILARRAGRGTTFVAALVFGLLTNLLPWFWMF